MQIWFDAIITFKHLQLIMVMLFVPLKFVRLSSIYTTEAVLLHEHETSILLDMVENQILKSSEAVLPGIALLIDQLKKVLVNRQVLFNLLFG